METEAKIAELETKLRTLKKYRYKRFNVLLTKEIAEKLAKIAEDKETSKAKVLAGMIKSFNC